MKKRNSHLLMSPYRRSKDLLPYSVQLKKIISKLTTNEKAGGVLLIAVTVLSLLLANSFLQKPYLVFWEFHLGHFSIGEWINEALMSIFFLMIGLEVKQEIISGQLSTLRKASLPLFAALGGMVAPALIYLAINAGAASKAGIGIPVATDIAFAIGILSLLGKRIPASLRAFLTAFAVIDDLGAILIIAIFYTATLLYAKLFIALGIFICLLALNKAGVKSLIPYLIGGIAMWIFMLPSGIHVTITGVLVAFAIPAKGAKGKKAPSVKLLHFLHNPVTFIILPLFAAANTCIPLAADWAAKLAGSNSIGIIAALIIGKPLGILLFSFLSEKLRISQRPSGITWKHILGAGILGGIGFTMSIFISLLAFKDADMISESKIAVLIASLVAGVVGFIYLKGVSRKAAKGNTKVA
jgi:NhaA family Na+:H+ antiporter